MGGPGQLFTVKELKSRNPSKGKIIKRDAVKAITAADAADIARIIIVVRDPAPEETPKKTSRRRKY
jgi:hypothetical protein